MGGSLCVVGLILLATLTEGSDLRHPKKKDLKNSFIPVPADGKTLLGRTLAQTYNLFMFILYRQPSR